MTDGDDRAPYRSVWTDLQGVSFSQAYVRVGDVDTRYLHAGSPDGAALIFLHGTGGHAEAYVRNLAAHGEHRGGAAHSSVTGCVAGTGPRRARPTMLTSLFPSSIRF